MKQKEAFKPLLMLFISCLSLVILGGCNILAFEQEDQPAPVISSPELARDFILNYLARKYGLALPADEQSWEKLDLIADPESPSQAVFYASDGLTVVVSYPKASPQDRLFNLTVKQEESTFSWDGFLTAAGRVTEITVKQATQTPSITPSPSPTPTTIPSVTPIPTLTMTPTLTPTPLPTRTETATPDPCNWASFVADITIPDGTSFAPGTEFTKIWRIKNIGSCTWTPEYSLVFVRGDRMDAVPSIPLPRNVVPGDSVDLAVDMEAPQRVGEYRGFWLLRTPQGSDFGLGPAANLTFWTSITVVESFGDFRYDFSLNLCAAIWRSASGRLTCTNTTDNPDGYVRLLEDPDLESGSEDETALWLHPNEALYGWIDGTYPYIRIEEGDRFKAAVGCLEDYGACNLVFYLDYEDEDGLINRLGRWGEVYDGEITQIDIDLSNLAGQSVRFILGLEANNQALDDAQGFWLLPRLENPDS